MDNKIKHLEMITAIIERMGKNSFQLKSWAMTLVSIIGALSAKDADKGFFILAFIPLIGFWIIDSFYLQIERKYSCLYERVVKTKEEDVDFSMNTDIIQNNDIKLRYWKCFFSKTEFSFYGLISVSSKS